MIMTVHNYRPRQFHRTLNGENPSRGHRDMGSASLAAAHQPAARTVMTIPLQPRGLRGKKAKKLNTKYMYRKNKQSTKQKNNKVQEPMKINEVICNDCYLLFSIPLSCKQWTIVSTSITLLVLNVQLGKRHQSNKCPTKHQVFNP